MTAKSPPAVGWVGGWGGGNERGPWCFHTRGPAENNSDQMLPEMYLIGVSVFLPSYW